MASAESCADLCRVGANCSGICSGFTYFPWGDCLLKNEEDMLGSNAPSISNATMGVVSDSCEAAAGTSELAVSSAFLQNAEMLVRCLPARCKQLSSLHKS